MTVFKTTNDSEFLAKCYVKTVELFWRFLCKIGCKQNPV